MSSRKPVRIAGAGALGLSVALALARKGVPVEVWDPGRLTQGASGVAAGMLAPATELVLDPPILSRRPEARDLLFAAQAHWLECAVGLNLPLDRCGALLPAFDGDEARALFRRFEGFEGARLLDGDEARARQPWLGPAVQAAVFVPQDWRLEPLAALGALRAAVIEEGGVFRRALLSTEAFKDGPVVIAAGYAATSFGLPELARLELIKGQLIRLKGGPESGPTVRAEGAYIVPQIGGAVVGASMEEGRAETQVEESVIARLLAAAQAVMPSLAGLTGLPAAGVRASTPDGLPLVGPSSRQGVFLATGARRNGWLLAPLVGRMVAAYLTGEDPGPFAAALDPRRFAR